MKCKMKMNKKILLILFMSFIVGCSVNDTNEVKVKTTNVHFYNDKIVIDLPLDYYYSGNHIGNSMYPVITENTCEIVLPVKNDTVIEIGDIISFNVTKEYCIKNNCRYMHRVVKKGIDNDGEYYITKGDNNLFKDRIRIRKNDINYMVIMIINFEQNYVLNGG